MAVQNPFFGKRENDSFPPRNSVTGLSTANATATAGASSTFCTAKVVEVPRLEVILVPRRGLEPPHTCVY